MREIRVADATGPQPLTLLGNREVIDDLQSGFLSTPTDEVADRHLADMLVVFEATRHSPRGARRRRRALLFGSTLGLGAVLAAGGAAAASGGLPAPAQEAMSRLVEPLGIVLPTGASDDAPGRGGVNPGHADAAPGQEDGPGSSEDAPGLEGENPGRSETAPGHSDSTNNAPTTTPASSSAVGNAPDVPPGLEDGTGRPTEAGRPVQADAKNGGAPTSTDGPSQRRDGGAPGRRE